jgi:hypothetical protein
MLNCYLLIQISKFDCITNENVWSLLSKIGVNRHIWRPRRDPSELIYVIIDLLSRLV